MYQLIYVSSYVSTYLCIYLTVTVHTQWLEMIWRQYFFRFSAPFSSEHW